MRRTVWMCACLFALACGGGSPTPVTPTPIETPPAPLPPPPPAVANIAGTWIGKMQFHWDPGPGDFTNVPPTGTYGVDVRAELQQQARTITGTWRITTPNNDAMGEISGMLDGADASTTFSGTVTWEGEPNTMTGRCRGSATFSGSAWGGLNWQSPAGWDFRGICFNSLSQISWTLRAEL